MVHFRILRFLILSNFRLSFLLTAKYVIIEMCFRWPINWRQDDTIMTCIINLSDEMHITGWLLSNEITMHQAMYICDF